MSSPILADIADIAARIAAGTEPDPSAAFRALLARWPAARRLAPDDAVRGHPDDHPTPQEIIDRLKLIGNQLKQADPPTLDDIAAAVFKGDDRPNQPEAR